MIVIDIETTGLDPIKNSIVSIGAVDFHNIGRQFYEECFIRPFSEIDPVALTINGFTPEQLYDRTKQSEVFIVKKFLDWASHSNDVTLAGENLGNLDIPILKYVTQRHNLAWPFGYRSLDLHSVSYAHQLQHNVVPPMKNGYSDLSLDKTLVYIGLPPEPKPHNALVGAKLEAEAFSRLMYGKTLFPEFKQYVLSEFLEKKSTKCGKHSDPNHK